jgi:hypothetical protein
MDPIRIQIGKVVQTFANLVGTKQGEEVMTAIAKLLFRGQVGRNSAADIRRALILTKAEEAALLKTGARFVVKLAGKIYVVACFTDLVVNLLAGEGQRRTPEERIGIVVGHVAKGSPFYVTLFAASEQLCFGLHDALFPETSLTGTAFGILENAMNLLPPVLVGPPIPPDEVRVLQPHFPRIAHLFEPDVQIVTFENDATPIVEQLREPGQPANQPSHTLFATIDP